MPNRPNEEPKEVYLPLVGIFHVQSDSQAEQAQLKTHAVRFTNLAIQSGPADQDILENGFDQDGDNASLTNSDWALI